MTETTIRHRPPGGDDRSRLDAAFLRLFGRGRSGGDQVSPRSPVILVQMAVIAGIAIAAPFQEPDHLGWVLAMLAVAFVGQPIVASLTTSSQRTWQTLFVLDLAVATAIVAMEPSVAVNHLILGVGLIGGAATCFGVSGFLAFYAAAIGSMAIAVTSSDLEYPLQLLFAAGVIGLIFGGWMLRTRLTTMTLASDLERTVIAGGGLFFEGKVGDPSPSFLGDMESLLGWSASDGDLSLQHLIHPDDLDDYWIPSELLVDGTEIERMARFQTKQGNWRWMREFSRVIGRDGELRVRGLLFDHTDQIDGLNRATTDATTDSLTGLANRRVLVKLLDRNVVVGRHLALLDLDSFKPVNDTLGHEAGDQLLRIVASRIASHVRSNDLVARLGGDEFAIVLDPGDDTSALLRVVERVVESISEPMSLNGVVVNTTASAGVVVESESCNGSTMLLRRADLAMYESKRTANTHEVFSPALESGQGRKGQLARDLANALSAGDLQLFFQPIVDIRNGAVVGAEGLARWDHEVYGVLAPGDFLDVVLVSSQAGAFTRSMVSHALDMAKALDARGVRSPISVNLPVAALQDDGFCTWLVDRCRAKGVPPSRLIFEISERELHVAGRAEAAISRLASHGAGVAIDDFGTGHATFDRLRGHDVGQLKLEQAVVQGAPVNERDSAILANVVRLADELGYQVVGEGVETERERALLERVGVVRAQGYLFAPALEPEEFLNFVETSPQRLAAYEIERAT